MTPDDLFNYMSERERIRRQKVSGLPPPWTTDPILQRYRFCNVKREDDVVSKWIHDNVVMKFQSDPDLVARVTFARHINLPRTLAQLPDELDIDKWIEVLNGAPRPIWNSAYMIRARPGSPLYPSKHADVLKSTIGPMRGLSLRKETLETATERLEAYWAMGGFMSYEVACDLRWLPGYLDLRDVYTWGNVGPGAARGLKKIGMTPTSSSMVELLGLAAERWPHQSVTWGRRLEVRDIEHSLCELDKYERAAAGTYGGRVYRAA